MKLLHQVLYYCPETLPTLLVTARSVLHCSLTPNLLTENCHVPEDAYHDGENQPLHKKVREDQVMRLLLHSDSIEFTQSLAFEYSDDAHSLLMQRLSSLRYSARSLRMIKYLDFTSQEKTDFLGKHFEVLEYLTCNCHRKFDCIEFLGNRFGNTLRSLNLFGDCRMPPIRNSFRLLNVLEHLSLEFLDMSDNGDILGLGDLKRLTSLELTCIERWDVPQPNQFFPDHSPDNAFMGSTLGEVLRKLSGTLKRIKINSCGQFCDLSGLAELPSHQMCEIKIVDCSLGNGNDNGLEEWLDSADEFPLLEVMVVQANGASDREDYVRDRAPHLTELDLQEM